MESKLDKASRIMICGSLPPGVPPHFYNHLIELAHRKRLRLFSILMATACYTALEAQPTVVTPNQQEAERLLNRALITRTHLVDAVERIHGMGA